MLGCIIALVPSLLHWAITSFVHCTQRPQSHDFFEICHTLAFWEGNVASHTTAILIGQQEKPSTNGQVLNVHTTF